MNAQDLLRLFETQHDLIFNQHISITEFVFILDEEASSIHTGYGDYFRLLGGIAYCVCGSDEAAGCESELWAVGVRY